MNITEACKKFQKPVGIPAASQELIPFAGPESLSTFWCLMFLVGEAGYNINIGKPKDSVYYN